MDDPKCRVTWEVQGGLEGVGSLSIAESWFAIKNVIRRVCQQKNMRSWQYGKFAGQLPH